MRHFRTGDRTRPRFGVSGPHLAAAERCVSYAKDVGDVTRSDFVHRLPNHGKLKAPIILLPVIVMLLSCSWSNNPSTATRPNDSLSPSSESSSLGSTKLCVDAEGPNSTPEQIVDAQLTVRLPSAFTGNPVTLDEQYLEAVPGTTAVPSKDREVMVDGMHKEVPAGGDARFVAQVCNLRAGWASAMPRLYDVGVTEDPTARIIGSTPHIIRGMGREICREMSGQGISTDPIVLTQLAQQVDAAKSNPEGWKNRVISQSSGMFAGMQFESPVVAERFQAYQRERLVRLSRTSADALVGALDAYYQFSSKAHEFLCPQFGA